MQQKIAQALRTERSSHDWCRKWNGNHRSRIRYLSKKNSRIL